MASALQSLLDKVPADKRGALETAIKENEDLVKELESGYMRQSDYSKKADELAAVKKLINEQWNEANEQYKQMLSDMESSESEKQAANLQLQEAEKKLREAEGKIVDTSKFVSAEEFDRRIREQAANETAYFTEALEVMDDVQELTGSRPRPRALIQEAIAARQTPSEYAEAKYKLSEKRASAETKRREDEQKKWREEGKQEAISQLSNPATRGLEDSRSPFFQEKEKGTNPWDMKDIPEDEKKMLHELTAAHGV